MKTKILRTRQPTMMQKARGMENENKFKRFLQAFIHSLLFIQQVYAVENGQFLTVF